MLLLVASLRIDNRVTGPLSSLSFDVYMFAPSASNTSVNTHFLPAIVIVILPFSVTTIAPLAPPMPTISTLHETIDPGSSTPRSFVRCAADPVSSNSSHSSLCFIMNICVISFTCT